MNSTLECKTENRRTEQRYRTGTCGRREKIGQGPATRQFTHGSEAVSMLHNNRRL